MIAQDLRKTLRFSPRDGKVCLVTRDREEATLPERMYGEYPVQNLSTDGLCLKVPFRLDPGDEYLFSFKAMHLNGPLYLKANVVWCTPDEDRDYKVGIRFTGVKPKDQTAIEQLPGCVDLKRINIDPSLTRYAPAALALRRKLVPFFSNGNTLHVAMANPCDTAALEALKRHSRMNLKIYQADDKDVVATSRLLYAGERTDARAEDDLQAVNFLNNLVRGALMRRASDIHLEPEPPPKARYRVDGRLAQGPAIADSVYRAVVSRVKVLAGLDIAEKREPQDGRMTWNTRGFPPVDMRVATIPTVHGEHVTIRLLGGNEGPKTLHNLGMLQSDLEIFEKAIAIPYGMILLTGPTGCGKSTTLYAALEAINEPDRHILSVEDPVERRIQGISQIQVDQADKVGFASALRSLLRHDPDVIMIGEIRDDLSLDVAIKSALTGHLVFSSLHTNDSTSAPARLVHMGAPPYLVAATLSLVVAQRLVRQLCTECRRPAELDERSARILGLEASLPVKVPGGCPACNGSGYTGRMGIFEFMVASDRVREMIVSGASAGRIRAATLEEGMRTLMQDGADKVRAGLTDPGEVMRAAAGTIEIKGGSE
jgi:type IV pilus assembly protein PilB